jgi:uncharacterized protein (TIGR00730 family)
VHFKKDSESSLLHGDESYLSDFFRLVRIGREFARGLFFMRNRPLLITVFGSARFSPDSPYSLAAEKLGAELAKNGFTVLTGGGGGIMEAANKGAYQIDKNLSLGCNIILPHEQKPNSYLGKLLTFRYFFVRKFMLIRYSRAFVIFPGGYGTLDEFFEALTLIQTGKLQNFPVILYDQDFWNPLMDWIENKLLGNETLNAKELNLFKICSNIDDIVQYIRSEIK